MDLLELFNQLVDSTAKRLNISNDESFIICIKLMNTANETFEFIVNLRSDLKKGGKA